MKKDLHPSKDMAHQDTSNNTVTNTVATIKLCSVMFRSVLTLFKDMFDLSLSCS